MKQIVCLFLAFLFVLAISSCGISETTEIQSIEDKVRECVINRATMAYLTTTIGGNEIKRSSAFITNVSKVSETEYTVNGKMQMTDIYGTTWTNTFDCTVKSTNGEEWKVSGGFNYKSSKWSKN